MCGIAGIFNFTEPVEQARETALKMSAMVRHRGPDWSGIYTDVVEKVGGQWRFRSRIMTLDVAVPL